MTISLSVSAKVRGTLSKAVDSGTASFPVNIGQVLDLVNGTGAGEANAIYHDAFSIAASGSASYDLAGALTDALGQATVFSAVKAILLIADSTNTNNVVLGNGANPFVGPFDDGTATITLKPGATLLVTDPSAAGWTVTAGTGDILKLANSGAGSAVTGTIVIIGEA